MTPQESISLIKVEYPHIKVFHLITKIHGADQTTIPENYWLIGILGVLKEGEPIQMTRLANTLNPGGRWGIFTSSPIISIDTHPDHVMVKTVNSTYRVEEI